MSSLSVTFIDVGWGDSILLESIDAAGDAHFALIDSNDTTNLRSSSMFVKRFAERRLYDLQANDPNASLPDPFFDWVLLTHAHADHGQGLKRILQDFGASQFWYPKSNSTAAYFTGLLRYAQRSSKVAHHQSIDASKTLPAFGDATMEIMWPPHGHEQHYSNENNNSVVLAATLGDVTMILTGDAEAEVWETISDDIPDTTRVFKAPHHGSQDAMFVHGDVNDTPWFTRLSAAPDHVDIAISSHVRPFAHPSPSVVAFLDQHRPDDYLRTDTNFHITFTTDGTDVTTRYTR